MDLGDVIRILFFYLVFIFIPSRVSKGRRGRQPRPVRGGNARNGGSGRRYDLHKEGRKIPPEVETAAAPRPPYRAESSARAAFEAAEKRVEANADSGKEEKDIPSGSGFDLFSGDSVLKGIIMAELLQPPLSRRHNRRRPV